MFSKAPWSSSKDQKPQEGGDQSLTTVLSTSEDRADLLMLVVSCIETMREQVSKTFDPDEKGYVPEKPDTEGLESLVKPQDTPQEEPAKDAPVKETVAKDAPKKDEEHVGAGIVMEDLDGDEDTVTPPGPVSTASKGASEAGDHIPEEQPASDAGDKGAEEKDHQPPTLPLRPRKDSSEQAATISDTADMGIGGTTNEQSKPMSEEEKARAAAQARKKKEEKAKSDHKRREDEINSEQMQDIKKAALTFFDDWRDRVYVRVGHAINEPEDKDKDQEEKAPPLPPRRSGSQKRSESTEIAKDDPSSAADTALHSLYPPHDCSLLSRPQPERILILHSLLLLLLSLESYPSHSRILLLHLASSLNLPLHILTDDESKVARGLLEAAKNAMSADDETQKKVSENAVSRRWKVGLGAVAGAALIGVTGGLAAPLLAAGIGTVMGGLGLGATAAAGYLGALAGSAPLVGALFGAYGGRMTGKWVDNYAREVEDFAFLPVNKSKLGMHNPLADSKDSRRLRIVIGISGWLTSEQEVSNPWHVLSPAGIEVFALRWELKALISLGNALTSYIKSAAWNVAKVEIIKRTIFGALAAGLWPITMLSVGSRVVDNPFSIAKSRADKAGAVLADAIINKAQGERPVTLVGYSLGARVIYACLQTLADRKAFGLVESVVLLGAACPSDSAGWRKARSVVGARVVNIYSVNDYLLGFLYRTSSLQYGIAGLQPVLDVAGVENVNVSELVDGHTKYRYLTGAILEKVGFEDIDKTEVARQTRTLAAEEEKEREEQAQKEEGAEGKDADAQAEELEREIERKNKANPLSWVSDKVSNIKFPGSDKKQNENAPVFSSREAAAAREQENNKPEQATMKYSAI